MNEKEVKVLAERHDLRLNEGLVFNEVGLDFQIVFASDQEGNPWVLRIPRRPDMLQQIEHEAKILGLMKKRLRICVPDWKIISPELIAYPLLPGNPTISFDPATHKITWNIDRNSREFVMSLARVLVGLHQTPISEATAHELKCTDPSDLRKRMSEDIERVKNELGMSSKLEQQLKKWVNKDSLWPRFSALVHGDLYAGHILTRKNGHITGIIDWSEAEVSDPSIDFAGHLAVFGEESLKELICEYEKAGGRTWSQMFDHIKERNSASVFKFAVFALNSGLDQHIATAKSQLSEA